MKLKNRVKNCEEYLVNYKKIALNNFVRIDDTIREIKKTMNKQSEIIDLLLEVCEPLIEKNIDDKIKKAKKETKDAINELFVKLNQVVEDSFSETTKKETKAKRRTK